MVSSEEIDWVLDQLGYYIILDGGKTFLPDMDNYRKIENFFYLSTQSDEDIIIENSESDGKTWYFDAKEFKSYIDDYVDELVLESHQACIFRKFLYNIYMPKYNSMKYSLLNDVQKNIESWEKELQEFKKYDYSNELKNHESIKDCTINFFLNDWEKHNKIYTEYKKDYNYSFCLTIYANGEIILEQDLGGSNNYFNYIDLVEEYAKHLPFVYLEIANIALCDEDGYGRFWCNVNDKTYYMEYKEDWNNYIDYKSLNEKEWNKNQDKRRKNHEMFKRWDKIRTIMGSEEIIIAEVPITKKEKESMPFIIKEEISIMKHSEPELYPNYFIWIEYFNTKKGEEDFSIIGADPNFYNLINLTSNINWINIELLENLEELYDLNK